MIFFMRNLRWFSRKTAVPIINTIFKENPLTSFTKPTIQNVKWVLETHMWSEQKLFGPYGARQQIRNDFIHVFSHSSKIESIRKERVYEITRRMGNEKCNCSMNQEKSAAIPHTHSRTRIRTVLGTKGREANLFLTISCITQFSWFSV